MSSPRFEPWLIPETISSGWNSTSPSVANLTQSTGVPSVANPLVPSSNSISSTQSGSRVVMLRAVALRLESGAMTASSTSGTASRAFRMAWRPVAWMPSSLVRRTFMGSVEDSREGRRLRPPNLPTVLTSPSYTRSTQDSGSITDCLEVEPVGRGRVARRGPWSAGQEPDELVHRQPARAHGQHRAHERPHHVAHEGVGLDPVLEAVRGRQPLRPGDVTLKPHVIALSGRESGEIMRAGDRR